MAPPRAEEGAAFASSTRSAALRLFASRLGFAVRQAKGQLFGGDRTRFVEPLQDVLDDIGAALVFGGVSVQSAPTALGYQLPLLQALASRLEVATKHPTSPVAPSSLSGYSSDVASSSAAHAMQESIASLSSKVDMILRSLCLPEAAAGRSIEGLCTGTGKGGIVGGGCGGGSRQGYEGGVRFRTGSGRGTEGGCSKVVAAEAPEEEEDTADEVVAKDAAKVAAAAALAEEAAPKEVAVKAQLEEATVQEVGADASAEGTASGSAGCEVGVVAGHAGLVGIVGGFGSEADAAACHDPALAKIELMLKRATTQEATAWHLGHLRRYKEGLIREKREELEEAEEATANAAFDAARAQARFQIEREMLEDAEEEAEEAARQATS